MKQQVDLSESDIQIIIKALSYLCVATHSRSVFLYAHGLEEKFKKMMIDKEAEKEENE